tara:strand:+ start:840 stop:1364 length:525 start_codon:yes stop_codon:yes gene_type:complete
MVLGVDDFKAKLRGGGARPNLFKATINFPAYAAGDTELTSFMCEAAQLPGSTTGMIEVPFRGRRLKLSGDRTFEPWTITVINDTNMAVRDSMERWMNGINSHTTNTGRADPLEYESDLLVDQLDKSGGIIKQYVFRGCFPTVVSPIDLSYTAENEIERFSVEFQIQYWESNTTT